MISNNRTSPVHKTGDVCVSRKVSAAALTRCPSGRDGGYAPLDPRQPNAVKKYSFVFF